MFVESLSLNMTLDKNLTNEAFLHRYKFMNGINGGGNLTVYTVGIGENLEPAIATVSRLSDVHYSIG